KAWRVVTKDEGIVVSKRSEPGRDLPSFKGTGLVKASIYEILAILRDGPRRKEWMSKSGKTLVLARKSIFEAISYQQTLAPFPVSDREVIMHTQVYLREEPREIIATFNGVKWSKPIPGVDRDDYVWMPYLKGYWRLTSKGDDLTEVTYMVNTDPGGMLPNMLIRRITHYVPLWTLMGLRKQAKRRKGFYEQFLNQYDPARTNNSPKAVPPAPPASVIKYLR
ncbi:MAG: hypothetical protein CMH49_00005, partial [Myxococcales bacterium]|nr:hypothetical protein [Myxococcales bacterium]